MSITKHTPGPWRVERQNGSPTTSEWMIAGAKPGYLAEVRDCGSGCAAANARLIAAAPELLDALESIIDAADYAAYKGFGGAEAENQIMRARSAITKAKGES